MTIIDHARILILASDGFEQAELFRPRERLKDLGAEVRIASTGTAPIMGLEQPRERPISITPDLTLDEVNLDHFDALLIPGGNPNPGQLCSEPRAIEIVRGFARAGKPVAACCEGSRLLVEAALVSEAPERGAGDAAEAALWSEGNLLTSHRPGDCAAFTEALIEMIAAR